MKKMIIDRRTFPFQKFLFSSLANTPILLSSHLPPPDVYHIIVAVKLIKNKHKIMVLNNEVQADNGTPWAAIIIGAIFNG